MYSYTWYQWLAFFYIYCFFGWIFESSYVSLKERRPVNRGFLRLPMLPLYGTGAIMMLWVSIPFKNHLILVYLSGVAAATILEYVTGYVMERLFKMKYWDYSHHRFQLNGYICLSSSVAWGFLTLLLTEVLHKPVETFVLHILPATVTVLVVLVSLVFAADAAVSVKQALDLGRVLEAMTGMKAELEELQVQIALLKAETAKRMTELNLSSLKKEAELKAAAIKEARDIWTQKASADFSALNARLQSVADKRRALSEHFGYYRRGLLSGNPTASSRQFGESLRELREALTTRRRGRD